MPVVKVLVIAMVCQPNDVVVTLQACVKQQHQFQASGLAGVRSTRTA